MKQRTIIIVLIAATILFTGAAVTAQGPQPQGPTAALGTSFTYQGDLKLNGNPVNGSCTFNFGLYDAASGGTQVGGTISATLPVTNGLFSLPLDFGAGPFTGNARWLQTTTFCPGMSGGITTTLTPRTALTAVPFALFSAAPWGTLGSSLYYTRGNVGIGTKFPAESLHTTGNIRMGGTHFIGDSHIVLDLPPINGTKLWIRRDVLPGDPSLYEDIMVVEGSGDVGIGTSSPLLNNRLDVEGQNSNGIYAQSFFPGSCGIDTCTDGGIGIKGENSAFRGIGVRGVAGDGGIGVWGTGDTGDGVRGDSQSGYGVLGTSFAGRAVYGSSSSGAGVYGSSSSGTGVSAQTDTGSIMDGYLNGTIKFRLDNTGKGFFNGGTQTGGADVAEFIAASNALRPGDVIEIDPKHPGQFRLAATPNSTAVAGVVSTNPGVTMNSTDAAGSTNDEGPRLALAGRVPVKVSAENGPIHAGDLLVASSTAGYAMHAPASPAPGTVIGKALGELEDGTGTVEMLVMLR